MKKLIGNCYVENNVAVGFEDEFEETLIIPEGVKEIAKSAFEDYYGMVNVIIPNSVSIIGEDAFSGCSNLRKIYLPKSVTELKSSGYYGGPFSSCSQLIEADLSQSSIKVLPKYLFSGCKKLQKIKLPNTLVKIDFAAFDECINLYQIVFNEGLKIIKTNFDDNKALTIINIPNSVIHIEDLSLNAYINTIVTSDKQLDKFREYLPSDCKFLLKG